MENFMLCKSIWGTILQNHSDTIINVSKQNDWKGRPILTGSNSPMQALRSLIWKILEPIVRN